MGNIFLEKWFASQSTLRRKVDSQMSAGAEVGKARSGENSRFG